jgi:hypothetical protein
MQSHVIPATRWLSAHRRELLLGLCLTGVLCLIAIGTTLLLPIATIEWWQRNNHHKRHALMSVSLLTMLLRTAHVLWCKLRHIPRSKWHPCAQCGHPIEEPSRAAYCSHACRTYARLERDALDHDPRISARAERRLRNRRLRALADGNPELQEVPF